MKADTRNSLSDRARAFAMALLYSFTFFSLLAIVAAFVVVPASVYLRTGVLDFSMVQSHTQKWASIVLSSSVITAVSVYAWAEWSLWRDRKNTGSSQ